MDHAQNLQRELGSWRDKWVYEAARDYYTRDLRITSSQVEDYFEQNKHKYMIRSAVEPTFEKFAKQARRDVYIKDAQKILAHKIDSLKAVYPVIINSAVLDCINVTSSQKSRWLSVQVFKQSSNRMAKPIVDPAWGL